MHLNSGVRRLLEADGATMIADLRADIGAAHSDAAFVFQ